MDHLEFEFNKTYIKSKKAYLVFDINTYNFGDKSVSLEDLKKYLNLRILKDEKDFIKLETYSKKQATYEFDLDKWLNKAITDKIINTPDRFEKKIKVNKLPSFITNYVNLGMLTSFVNGTFRNYLEKNKKFKKTLLNSVRAESPSQLKIEYDSYYNNIVYSLKSEFRTKHINTVKENRIDLNFDRMVLEMLNARRKKS